MGIKLTGVEHKMSSSLFAQIRFKITLNNSKFCFHDHHRNTGRASPLRRKSALVLAKAWNSLGQVLRSSRLCCSAQQRAHSPQYHARWVNKAGSAGVELYNKPDSESGSVLWPPVFSCYRALCSVLLTHSEVLVNFQISGTPVGSKWEEGKGRLFFT